MTIKEKIEETIKLLKDTDINGCITGSSMIDGDFDAWESQPDIDLFVYSRPQMFYAIHLLMMKYGFKPINDGEIWKLDRMNNFETRKKLPVDTHKLERDGIIVNVTYKENKNNPQKKTSGLAARLEAMQKQAEELQRQRMNQQKK
jgi:hypothetical protein